MWYFILSLILIFPPKDLWFEKERNLKKQTILFLHNIILKILRLQRRRLLFFISSSNFSLNERSLINFLKIY